jgi:cellulose synthase/poly-beta-1,6-N-acetylglucosamine synthase-like glycosyltransferase
VALAWLQITEKESKVIFVYPEGSFAPAITLYSPIFTMRILRIERRIGYAHTGMLLQILFWVLVAGVFYTYAGYAMLAWLWVRLRFSRRGTKGEPDTLPSVSLIIPAYNEAGIIAEKIRNSLSLQYPPNLLKVVVITDGSTDSTPALAASFPGIEHLHQPERKGKIAALNRAAAFVSGTDILVFSDANTMLNPEAIRRLVVHYQDALVGGVSGEKKVLRLQGSAAAAGEEGMYWRYESAMKKLDAALHSLVGAAGELFSMRASLFQGIPEDIILDDFYISMKICERGYLVKYEPGAFAAEKPSMSIADEKERKIRISAGAFQAMKRLGYLANPFRYGMLGFQFLSRRVMRWVFCPIALPLILIINILLVLRQDTPPWLYQGMLVLQSACYFFALAGWIIARANGPRIWVFSLPFYFTFMNLSVWLGFARFIKGGQSALWQKASRD